MQPNQNPHHLLLSMELLLREVGCRLACTHERAVKNRPAFRESRFISSFHGHRLCLISMLCLISWHLTRSMTWPMVRRTVRPASNNTTTRKKCRCFRLIKRGYAYLMSRHVLYIVSIFKFVPDREESVSISCQTNKQASIKPTHVTCVT